jgi:radical SAM protein with 4Fe4S-binding SPASM domain
MKIPGSLQTIINNGKELQKRGVDVKLAIPALMENYKTIGESIDFFLNLGFPIGINFTKLISDVNNSETIAYMNSEDFFCTLIADLKGSGVNISLCSDSSNNELCQGLKSSIMVDTKGDIHPCTAFRDFIIGSIFDPLPLHDLLENNKEYHKLRRITKDELICAGCQHYNHCSPCLARQHTQSHCIDGPYPATCNLTRTIHKLSTKAKE